MDLELITFILAPDTNLRFSISISIFKKTHNCLTFLPKLANIPSKFKLLFLNFPLNISNVCQIKDIVIIFSIVQISMNIISIIWKLFNIIKNEKCKVEMEMKLPFFCWVSIYGDPKCCLRFGGAWLECIWSPPYH